MKSNERKRAYAERLYIEDGWTAKSIADTVGVSENTVGAWIKKYSWKEGYRFAGETSVFLDEKYRGQGLGYLLKKELVGQARQLGYKHLVARIMAHNKVSIHYNLKLGYEMVGVQKQIGFTDGQWVDVAILQLILDGGTGDFQPGTPDH